MKKQIVFLALSVLFILSNLFSFVGAEEYSYADSYDWLVDRVESYGNDGNYVEELSWSILALKRARSMQSCLIWTARNITARPGASI